MPIITLCIHLNSVQFELILHMSYPISVDENGLNLKPEKMEQEKLYHCIFKNKVILVFKDSQDMLNCYEIEEEEIVKKISKITNDDDLAKFFDDYINAQNLNN